MENRAQKFCSIPLLFFQRFDHGAALKIECKMLHLNIAFDPYASTGTGMHYILVISIWRRSPRPPEAMGLGGRSHLAPEAMQVWGAPQLLKKICNFEVKISPFLYIS